MKALMAALNVALSEIKLVGPTEELLETAYQLEAEMIADIHSYATAFAVANLVRSLNADPAFCAISSQSVTR